MNAQLLIISLCLFGAVTLAGAYAFQSGSVFMQRYRANFMEQASVNLADMFLFVDPRRLFSANLIALFVVPVLAWMLTGNLLLAAVVTAVVAVLPKKLYRWLRQRRINRIQAQLPDALMMLSGGMKAGLGFRPALESLVRDGDPPLAQELALVLREQHLGVTAEESLANLAERVPIIDMQLFVSAVSIAREAGGNLAESLSTLAETLRRRLIMESKVRALTSQGKLQGIVMAMLPVGLVAYLAAVYPETMAPMFNTWIGYGVITLCLLLQYIGYKMCVKIMAIDI
jgi:tight adherence protein B